MIYKVTLIEAREYEKKLLGKNYKARAGFVRTYENNSQSAWNAAIEKYGLDVKSVKLVKKA